MTDEILEALTAGGVWDTGRAHELLEAKGESGAKRSTERKLHELAMAPELITTESVVDERAKPPNSLLLERALEGARAKRRLVLFVQLHTLKNGRVLLSANDARSARYWTALSANWTSLAQPQQTSAVLDALNAIQQHVEKPIHVFAHGPIVELLRFDNQ